MRGRIVPDPDPVWKNQGQTVCSCCQRAARCLSVESPEGRMADLCEGCLMAMVSPWVKALLDRYFEYGEGPVNVREQHLFRSYRSEQAHSEAMFAVVRRYFWKPTEAKERGHKSLESAVGQQAHPVLWLLEEGGLPDWLETLLHHVPGKRMRGVS
jgi:hypothetical protein